MMEISQSGSDPFIEGERLPIGVDRLDMDTPRGLPKGSAVALLGDPRGMADLFLMHLIRTGRPTRYISTVRPEYTIRRELDVMGDGHDDNLKIVETFARNDESRAVIADQANKLEPGHNFIIDTVSNLYNDENEDLLRTLRPVFLRVAEREALAFMYFAVADPDDLTREEREALHLSDAVFHVRTGTRNEKVITWLELLKLRGSEIPDQAIRFKVGESLRIDTSRDIA